MSRNPSATRSSRSPLRYSPYSHPPSSSPLPSYQYHLPSSGHHVGTSSDDYLSPVPAYPRAFTSNDLFPPTTNSATGYPFIPPILNPELVSTAQPSISSQHNNGQAYLFAQQLTYQSPYHPNTLYADPTVFQPAHSLPSSDFQHGAWLSTANYSIEQQQLQVSQDLTSTLQGPTFYGSGMLSGANQFSIQGGTFINQSSNIFMEKFLQHTLIGAEFDSSQRYPPPRCHPGTRLAIIHRCLDFIVQCNGREKLRWIVGPAGVGKSAVMQIVAEEIPANVVLGASVFLSTDGRKAGTKVITTIAYQLAVKCAPYRHFLQYEIDQDPTLYQKSLPAQFNKFIFEPFTRPNLFDSSRRYVIIIDGLDECDNPSLQRVLLELISSFCDGFPTSPVVWFVASRPEPHIVSFFDNPKVASVYVKEELMVDSNQACQDVQRYLSEKLERIKVADPSLSHKEKWPSQLEFTKIATAAGGLFAYASTVVRYIGDNFYGDPVAQLHDVLVVIDANPKDDILEKGNPMAMLDALYERILSKIPDGVRVNTRRLLLLYSNYGWFEMKFRTQCNVLGLTEHAAYSAVRHVHSVLKIPKPANADKECLEYHHKSFRDYLFNFKRSGFCRNINDEAEQVMAQSVSRIYQELPDVSGGMASRANMLCDSVGLLKGNINFCNSISLSWPGDQRFGMADHMLRLELYRGAMTVIRVEFSPDSKAFGNMPCFGALTTLITKPFSKFANFANFYKLQRSVFDKFRSELTGLGQLKQVPLRTLSYTTICGPIELRFTSPTGTNVKLSDPWNLSCIEDHDKTEVDCAQQWRGWSTLFEIPLNDTEKWKASHSECFADDDWHLCDYCSRRFVRYLMSNPDHLATVFVDSTEMCYVELTFGDPDDGVSQWRYRFFHSGAPTWMT